MIGAGGVLRTGHPEGARTMSSPEPVPRMRIDLTQELAEPLFPPGVSLHTFAENDAQRLHTLLEHGYRQGGGSVEAFPHLAPATPRRQRVRP